MHNYYSSDDRILTSHCLNLQKCRFILGQRISDKARNNWQKICFQIFLENLLHHGADDVNFLSIGPGVRLRVRVHAFVHGCGSVLLSGN